MKSLSKLFVAVLLLVNIFFVSCSKDSKEDEFKAISWIQYTTAGEEKVERSIKTNYYTKISKISRIEHINNYPERIYEFQTTGQLTTTYRIPKVHQGKTEIKEYPLHDKYYTYIDYNSNLVTYYLYKHDFSIYYYVYVQIVNDTTIRIKNKHQTTTYTVSSYSVEYLSYE